MANTIIIRKAFSSRDDAEAARDRLHYGGFPREDIAIVGVGEQFELALHTRPEDAQRVQDCINSSDLMLQAARYGRLLREHAPSAAQSLLLLGGIATTAVALVYAFSRNRQRWLNDTGNIDRRWDRADRLADTRYEDRASERDQRFGPSEGFGSPGLSPQRVGYGA
jgi:hypothetical protein